MTKTPFIALLLASSLLTGCIPLVAVGAGTAGVAVAQEGGISAAVTDTTIKATINDLYYRHDQEMFQRVKMTVEQGRVLLTGVVQNPEHRVEAVRLAWQAKGVKQVINEIQVGAKRTIGDAASDTRITGQLKTQMLFYKDIQSINYSIDTVNGVVYLMGVAQDQKELNRVIRLAQKVDGVKQVVSYVKFVGEKIVKSAPGSSTSQTSMPVQPAPVSAYPSQPGAVYSGGGLNPSDTAVQSEVLPP